MKFATHMPLFGQDKWIMRAIENSYPHVDRIYIAYSASPWGYNPQARGTYTNSFDVNRLVESKFSNKITIIYGDWLTEEAQRNACVDKAKEDGIDYLMIHDADEFYFHDDFEKIKSFINNNPNFDVYTVPWICFWKSFKYAVVGENGSILVGNPQVFINLKKGVRFLRKRVPTSKNIIDIGEVTCYHGSYVLTDAELEEKLKTWGHYNDFNVMSWFENIWKKWNINSTNLHPVSPRAWKRVVEYNKELPEVISDLK